MTKKFGFSWVVAAMFLSASAFATDIQVEGAWSRATAPGQNAGMVDLTITSQRAATLVGVTSPSSRSAELHSMFHEGGMMKMREVKAIELPAGKPVNLGENGYHLMLIDLRAPLKAGDSVQLVLEIRTDEKQSVKVKAEAKVKPLTESSAEMMHGEHMQHHH